MLNKIEEVILNRENPFKPTIELKDAEGFLIAKREVTPQNAWEEYLKTAQMVADKVWSKRWAEKLGFTSTDSKKGEK